MKTKSADDCKQAHKMEVQCNFESAAKKERERAGLADRQTKAERKSACVVPHCQVQQHTVKPTE